MDLVHSFIRNNHGGIYYCLFLWTFNAPHKQLCFDSYLRVFHNRNSLGIYLCHYAFNSTRRGK